MNGSGWSRGANRVLRPAATSSLRRSRAPMCYHVYMKSRRRVGVRAMRQSLSVYLRRVGSGESFEVTARGRPVAVLAPFEDAATSLERLAAAGRASLPEGDLLELGPPPKLPRLRRLSEALQEQRAERF